MTPKYVAEYDGLRAIAVLGVLLFHFNFNFLPGGFVGVDVFFVISGFLISRIILTDLAHGRFSLLDFYERRFRRIAPALFVVLSLTIISFAFISFPSEILVNRKSLAAAIFSYSNIYFYFTTDYFHGNDINPFLHTWSLSVEEQFYLAFPLLLIGLQRLKKSSRELILAAVALISLIGACVYVYIDASAAFYLPWLRAWELMTGTAVAILRVDRINSKIRSFASIVGVVLVGVAFLGLNRDSVFPGISALIPVAAAALIIIGVGEKSIVNGVLGSRLFVFFGKISYSLYLVHWPIVCAFATFGLLDGRFRSIAGILLSIFVAWISYTFVEQKFRHGKIKNPKRVYGVVAGCALLVLFVGTGSSMLANSIWEANPGAMALARPAVFSRSHLGNSDCFLTSRNASFDKYDKETCLALSDSKKNILVIGDSHSAHFMHSLQKADPSINFLQASASGCLPLLHDTGGAARCTELFNFIYHEWLPLHAKKIDTVLISARWEARNSADLVALYDLINGLGLRLVILGPTPEFQIPLPNILAFKEIYGWNLTNSLLKKDRFAVDDMFKSSLPEKIDYYSTVDRLCKNGKCSLELNGFPTFFDKDHLTEIGADEVVKDLVQCLDKKEECRQNL